MKNKTKEYKRAHIKIQFLKLKYFLKIILTSIFKDISTRIGTSSEGKKTVHSNGIQKVVKKTVHSNGIKKNTNKLLKLILSFWQPA